MDTTKLTSALIIALLISGSLGFLMTHADKTTDNTPSLNSVTFSFSQPTARSHGAYAEIRVDGVTACQLTPGYPMLPVRTRTFTLPFGTELIDVRVHTSEVQSRSLEHHIAPAPRPVPLNMQHAPIQQVEGPIYNTTTPYPSVWVDWHTGAGMHDGEHATFFTLRAFPTRYIPQQQEIQYVTNITVSFTCRAPSEPLLHGNDEYDLLILAPSLFADDLQPLVNHKESRNLSTNLVTLEDIYNGTFFEPEGRDQAEQIKYFIKNAVESWDVRYVMLVGDDERMPARYVAVDDGEESRYLSDLYYADLFGADSEFLTWDSNDNSLYGEFTGTEIDDVDLYPDVYLGRLACRTIAEVQTVVDKIIAYETINAYQMAWFKDIVYCGGDTFPGDEDGVNEGEYANQAVIDAMDGFNACQLWASNDEIDSTAKITSAISQGAGFVDFSGHGSPTSWATHPPERANRWLPRGGYTISSIESLFNEESWPIVILNACSNAKFSTDCIAWSFLSQPEKGAIAVCGNTALGYGYVGSYVTEGLSGFMELHSFLSYKNGAETFGELWADTLQAYVNRFGSGMDLYDYKSVEEWEPFGDPSLAIAAHTDENTSPSKPAPPLGPSSGKRWRDYTYQAVTTDPDGDEIYYMFDWGDGTNTSWLGPYPSNTTINATHSWERRGEYEIKVKARDSQGRESAWSDPLPISMPLMASFRTLLEQVIAHIRPFLSLWLPVS